MRLYCRRQVLVGAAALATAGAALAAEPRRVLGDFNLVSLDGLIPLGFGGWQGIVDPDVVPESVDASVDHARTLTRRYVGEEREPVMLVVSYHGSESPDLKVHRPETCYAVAGFEGARPAPIGLVIAPGRTVPSVVFSARREDRIETVLYWTRVGARFPQTLSGQRFDFFAEALRGVRADGLLVRTSVIAADKAASLKTLRRFAAAMVHAAPPKGRELLLGSDLAHAL